MSDDPVDSILDGLIKSAAEGQANSELQSDPPVGKHQDDRESSVYVGTTEAGTTTKTEAPTNAGTYEALDERIHNPALTEKQHDFVSLIVMHWDSYGELLTASRAAEDYNVPESKFVKYMGSSQVRSAIEERGVSFRGLDYSDKWRSNALTPLQLLAAQTFLDLTDTRGNKKKLQDLGIDTRTWNSWLRDPVFKDYLERSARKLRENSSHEADLALIDGLQRGNPQLIKLYFEMTGQYIPKSQQVGPDIDLQGLLTRILEIILEEVKDPQVAARISDKLMGLGTANNLATNMLEQPPIKVPEVMPARELSPELKEMMDNGIGINV